MTDHILLICIIALAATFGLSAAFCAALLPFLRRLKVGQPIREEGPKEHLKKAGTPTMGGISFILAIAVSGLVCAIVLKETGLPVGSIGLHFHSDLAEKDDECELGYWLGKPYWGHGIMPEACTLLLKRAFEDLNVSKVWCGYYQGNEKSKRVQEKLGFKYNRTDENVKVKLLNEVRTNVVNLMTKEDWEQLNN